MYPVRKRGRHQTGRTGYIGPYTRDISTLFVNFHYHSLSYLNPQFFASVVVMNQAEVLLKPGIENSDVFDP